MDRFASMHDTDIDKLGIPSQVSTESVKSGPFLGFRINGQCGVDMNVLHWSLYRFLNRVLPAPCRQVVEGIRRVVHFIPGTIQAFA